MRAISFMSGLLLSLSLLPLAPFAAEKKAGDWKFEAQLIWGTDKEKSDDPNLKPVDSKLVGGLQKIFKWKYYYQVGSLMPFGVPANGNKKVKLSKKCEIEVHDLGKPMIEVSMWGEGKLVKRVTHKAIQCLVMGGDNGNDTAWFVVITPE